jgi:hypothetical protein
VIVGILAWLGLALQFYLIVWSPMDGGPGGLVGASQFFGYFTILTNLIVALVLTSSLLPDRWRASLSSPTVRAATATYIAMVGIVYSVVLRDLWNPQGAQKWADVILHDAVPVLYVLHWIAFQRTRTLRWRAPVTWLLFPAGYVVCALLRGVVTGWYPYPFLDASVIGWGRVAIGSIGLLVGFVVLGLLVVAIDRARSWFAGAMQVMAYLYFLRVPFLVAALVGTLTFQGSCRAAAAYKLVHGVFDVGPMTLFVVAFLAGWLTLALSVQADTILRFGDARFRVPAPPPALMRVVLSLGQLHIRLATAILAVIYGVLCLSVVWAGWKAGTGMVLLKGVAVLAGALTTVLVLWLGLSVGKPPRLVERVFAGVGRWVGRNGYFDGTALIPNHGLATLCLAFFAFVYLAFAFGPRLWPHVPTLVSLLSLALLLAFLGAGASYLFDGLRVPVLIPVVVGLWLTALSPDTDEVFIVRPAGDFARATPRDVLEKRGSRAIVVCAAGGGIQAGAWATQVLAGLTEETGGEFARHLRLISSVSGGSYGTMYFTGAYEGGGVSDDAMRAVRQSALVSSLDELAEGFVFGDLLRLGRAWPGGTAVFGRLLGRGDTLEATWADAKTRPAAGPASNTLNQWSNDVRQGTRPAHIFNAMGAERGRRFVFSTVDLGGERPLYDFNTTYPKHDVAVVTAARVSSAFPWIVPAARINVAAPDRPHLVDGGYYDNYGVVSAIDFLLEGTTNRDPQSPLEVLLIEISGAHAADKVSGARGWFYQFFAPLQGLMAMRTQAQKARNEVELTLLGDVLRTRQATLTRAAFRFADSEPLSWHLTASEKGQITEEWTTPCAREQVQIVRRFLGLPVPASLPPACPRGEPAFSRQP